MTIKVTMFFEETQGTTTIGWSESYYSQLSDLNAIGPPVIGAQGLAYYRTQCLGAGVENTYNRATVVQAGNPPIAPQRRNVLPLRGLPATSGPAGPWYNPAFQNLTADFGQTAFMMRIGSDPTAAIVYERTLWLSGIPDASDQINTQYLVPGTIITAIAAFFSFLTTNGWQFQVNDRSPISNPFILSTGWAGNVFTLASNPFQAGQRIQALGWRGPPGAVLPKGVYKVASVSGNTITLAGALNTSTTAIAGGFRAVSYAYEIIETFAIRGVRNKKRGRPFGLLVGRARTRTRPKA